MNRPLPDGTPRLVIITIHGIGEYEASQAIQALSASDANDGWLDAAQKIDFKKICQTIASRKSKQNRTTTFHLELTAESLVSFISCLVKRNLSDVARSCTSEQYRGRLSSITG